MLNLPNVEKFTGYNEVSFHNWILRFEAQVGALGIPNARRNQMLLCCLDATAFTYLSQLMIADADITYEQIKTALSNKFTCAEYKRKLEIKLRGLRFT